MRPVEALTIAAIIIVVGTTAVHSKRERDAARQQELAEFVDWCERNGGDALVTERFRECAM